MEKTLKKQEIKISAAMTKIITLAVDARGTYLVHEDTKHTGFSGIARNMNHYATKDKENAIATFNRRVKKIESEKKK